MLRACKVINQRKSKLIPIHIINLILRFIYKCAFFLWRVTRKYLVINSFGAQVVVKYRGAILLVKSSYRTDYSFPGGYINRRELPIEAAVRELFEETGIQRDSSDLVFFEQFIEQCGSCTCSDMIYESVLNDNHEIELKVNNTEIVDVGFFYIDEVAELAVDSIVQKYLEKSDLRRVFNLQNMKDS